MKPSSTNRLFTVIDVETTINDPEPSRFGACPFHTANKIVLWGTHDRWDDGEQHTHCWDGVNISKLTRDKGSVLVGQNFKFDLHYLRNYMTEGQFVTMMNNCYIWDTQIAEYVLSGQIKTMISMDDLSRIYGLDTKASAGHHAISRAFEEGKGADMVDPRELEDYLKHDLETTGDIAEQQMARATESQFNLIIEMGEALKAVQEMEFNGMFVDPTKVDDMIMAVQESVINGVVEATVALHEYAPVDEMTDVKDSWYNSGNIVSAILFGGTVEYVVKEPAGLFKTGARKGTVKMRNVTKEYKFPAYRDPSDVGSVATKKTTKKGEVVYTTDEAVLNKVMAGVATGTPMHKMMTGILEVKKFYKILNTYLLNFKCMNIDSIIHHQLNQTLTSTGRLSSSKPNLQNVPMATSDPLTNVKRVFTSRFVDGVIMEIDFKQLEVCVLAWLTQDAQLLEDIRLGRDIHTEVGELILGAGKVTKRERRDIKTVVFAMIYGAGAKGIHLDSGIPLNKVKDIIKGFYDRYPEVNSYFGSLSEKVKEEGHCLEEIYRGPHGPEHYFEWTSPTGRTYKFHQDPFRPGPKYTELRNYPVQGTATGDIVPVLMGHIVNVLRNDERNMHEFALVNTTHDSVTLDCFDEEWAHMVKDMLNKEVFDRVDVILNETFPGMKWNVPLTTEVEMGPSWGEMKEVDSH